MRQAVFALPLPGANLAPAQQLLQRLGAADAQPASVLARGVLLKVVYLVRPQGTSSSEPIETELHLPDQLQAAVGAPYLPLQATPAEARICVHDVLFKDVLSTSDNLQGSSMHTASQCRFWQDSRRIKCGVLMCRQAEAAATGLPHVGVRAQGLQAER